MDRNDRPVVIAAIVIDLLALALLVVAVVQTVLTGFLSSLLTDLVVVPIAVIGSVVSAFAIIGRARRRRPLVVAATVLLALGSVPLGFGAVLVADPLTVNPARDAVHAVGRTIEAAGGRRICDSGDPGFGPDNVQPWDVGFYEAPAGRDLPSRLAERAKALGLGVRTGGPDIGAKRISVSIDEGIDTDGEVCGGSLPRLGDGTELIRITASAPPHA